MNLLCDVYKLTYNLKDEPISDETRNLCDSILASLEDKIRSMKLRKAFSEYKTAPHEPKRDFLRKEYIRLAEIHRSFISEKEIPYTKT